MLRALLGLDTFRFTAMLASFTFVYKFVLNSLPLLPIHERLSILLLTPHTERSCPVDEERDDLPPQQISIPPNLYRVSPTTNGSNFDATNPTAAAKKNHSRLVVPRWHAALAGALAGLSIVWEKKSRRTMISQQLFVR